MQQETARRSRVDQLIQHVVAQENVTMTSKSKATCANKVGQGCRQCASTKHLLCAPRVFAPLREPFNKFFQNSSIFGKALCTDAPI